MAADSSKFPAWFFTYILRFLLVSASFCCAGGTAASPPCVDGTYEHEGRKCCLCAAGLYLEKHCTTNLQYGECKICAAGMYSSHPNYADSCELCKSCSQPNANQEEDEPCTPARNTKCRCKKGHYCNSGAETCIICYPCKECGDEGIKEACTLTNNTVCNEKTDGGNKTGTIVGIIVGILVLLSLVLLAFLWKKKWYSFKRELDPGNQSNGRAHDLEMQSLTVAPVDLQPLLHELAEVIGWRDVHYVATRSRIPKGIIESCQLDHGDNQDQTRKLLEIWVEKQGRNASKNLVKILQEGGKTGTAERVMEILSRESSAT
ncbi:tumor necrosis factor receptor superfamily member 6 [Plectropomus leopardus]|uniref:tumor necrosis factor receptor superfamily member 6 n=1 Tax=Plectropomus leopardus TaxID=160734 RepID=UPI001C4CCD96|nr:tumor necrosis factor receptor superfamily member 6 [Plectropomus leopardus]